LFLRNKLIQSKNVIIYNEVKGRYETLDPGKIKETKKKSLLLCYGLNSYPVLKERRKEI
jgi:hypothetical protein